MKKISLIIALICSFTIFAQETVEEGVVTSVQKMSSPNPELSAQLAMVGDIVTTTEFKKDKTRSQTSSIMMGNTTVIMDNVAKKTLMLTDNPTMGKTFTLTDVKEDSAELDKFEITKGENTKTVLGYVCQEYLVKTSQKGAEIKMSVFTTDKIKAQNAQTQSMGSKLNGFPMYLKVELNQGGMDMVIESEVTKVDAKSVDAAIFSLDIPEGYKEATKPAVGQ